MLIGEVMELTPDITAAENMANRLADQIRNIWLENTSAKNEQWEKNFYEDPDGINFLRGEAFPNLQGIDYIFKWWGSTDPDGLAGSLEVLRKVYQDQKMRIYKTTIRFAERDFTLNTVRDEASKRELNRGEFRKAFRGWQKLYVAKALE